MFNLSRTPYGFILKTDWKWLIKLAWGKRLLTSRARKQGLEAYPKCLTAAVSLWNRWMIRGLLNPHDAYYVVHTKRAILKQTARKPPKTRSLTDQEIVEIQTSRADLRKSGNYAEADKLRDILVKSGVVVSDT